MMVRPKSSFDGILNLGYTFKFYKSKKYNCRIDNSVYYVENNGQEIPFDNNDFEETFNVLEC